MKVRIGKSDMDRLVDAVHDDPVEGFWDIWRTIEPEWDNLPPKSVRPGDYVLTHAQSTELVGAMKEGCVINDLDTWVAIGTWLQNGPGTEEAA